MLMLVCAGLTLVFQETYLTLAAMSASERRTPSKSARTSPTSFISKTGKKERSALFNFELA